MPHHSKMLRPLHGELYVSQSGRFEIIVCILYSRRIHGFRQPLKSVGSEFGQQTGDISEVMSWGTVGNTRLPRTRTKRKALQTGGPYDLLRGFQQGGAKVSMMISITFARRRRFLSRCLAHGFRKDKYLNQS